MRRSSQGSEGAWGVGPNGVSLPRMFTLATIVTLMWLVSCAVAVSDAFEEYADLARRVAAVSPTPAGEGHLGQLESGAYVQLRFPVPKPLPLGYAVELGNVVAYTGRGTSYKLLLRRDSENGAVMYEGPTVRTTGDDWNAENRRPIDLTAKLTEQDAARGYLDVFVTAYVEGDGWTVYRHNEGRPIAALVVEGSDEVRQALEQQKAAAHRGVAVIPAPQRLLLRSGEFRLTSQSRVVLPPKASEEDKFAAADLVEQIYQVCGKKLSVQAGGKAGSNDITLSYGSVSQGNDDEYRITVDGSGVSAVASGAPGLFYAAQTVAQLVTERGTLPFVTIEDWPAYPLRGIQYDVARGQTVNVDWWKRLIQMLARFKLNAIMIYGEDDYNFRAFPFLGRKGTFTPEKAREISDFAAKYHVQLIPQFESLGHASAVLQHEELAALREAGNAWVFCTSNPKTWEFLDTVFGELVEQFPSCQYIHTGCDEFEMWFGKCPNCSAKVQQSGYAGLYAEHMNRLNQLVKKRGRTMLFWPSHGGPTEELSYLTTKAHAMMQLDCIPTEWIYHGPSAYPELEAYQRLGFRDVWASPAVVCFSRIWPDYRTTYRGIRGFLRAGANRGIRGAMTTTWEWMRGGVAANSLLGMVYAAECSWSLGKTSVEDYERRYGQRIFGLGADGAAEKVRTVLAEPWPEKGPGAILRDSHIMTDLFWENPRSLRSRFVLRHRGLAESAEAVVREAEAALQRLAALQAECTENWERRAHGRTELVAEGLTGRATAPNVDLLDYSRLAFEMYRYSGLKVLALETASEAYQTARREKEDAAVRGEAVEKAADVIEALMPQLDTCIRLYQQAVEQLGAYAGDVEMMQRQKQETVKLVEALRELAAKTRGGGIHELPPASQFGLIRGQAVRIGQWEPAQMSEKGCEIRIDVTGKITAAGEILVEWNYTRGAHGVHLDGTTLVANGKVIASDEHAGWTGAGSRDNVYSVKLGTFDPQARYEIVGKMRSSGGTDSHGEVWLIFEEDGD